MRRRNGVGRIGIDLPAVLRDGRHIDNLLLQDGDSIRIPTFSAIVTVGGAVNSPVAVTYVPGRDMDYYIAAAGGAARNADLRRAYVTQPSGKVQSRPGRFQLLGGTPEPRAGANVFVPERDPQDRRNFGENAAAVAQVLTSILAVVAILSQVRN